MTTRIDRRFETLKGEGRAALVTFLIAGDPDLETSRAILNALPKAGADLIELGMPFTDPMADGPAIELANLRSLGSGTKTKDIFHLATTFRARHPHTPLILMGYANPMLIRGAEWFANQCREAGVDGVICVDVPPEEDAEIGPALRAAGVHLIRLATPTTDAARLPAVLDGASGFLYHVAVAGVTGKQQAAQAAVEQAVEKLKSATSLPIAVGFGVRSADQAAAIGRVADGVVVGSAIVDIVGSHGDAAAPFVQEFVATLSGALKANSPHFRETIA